MNALTRMLVAMAVVAASFLPAIGLAETQQVGDYTWHYTVTNGEATIEYGNGEWQRAVEPEPVGAVEIPSELGGCPVTGVGYCAFVGCEGLTSVTIPSGVTSIGDYAFWHCYSLTSVTIPASVTSIGRNVFEDCDGLTSVTIPSRVTSIGPQAFSYCSVLLSIEVSEGNASYSSADGMLFDKAKTTLVACPGGKRGAVTIPSGVTSIGDNAFDGCHGLTSVTIPSSVTSVGYEAFANCDYLRAVKYQGDAPKCDWGVYLFSENVTSYVLAGTNGWDGNPESTVLPESWPIGDDDARPIVALDPSSTHTVTFDLGEHGTRTGGGALSQAVAAGSAAVAPEVTALDGWIFVRWDADFSFVTEDMTVRAKYKREGAFNDGHYTQEIGGYTWSFTVTDGEASIEYGKGEWHRAVEPVPVGAVEIPSELGGCPVTKIGYSAFLYCNSMVSITLPPGLEEIGEGAFSSCGFNSIVIPASVKRIGTNAFSVSGKSGWLSIWYEGDCPMAFGAYGNLWQGACSYVRAGTRGWDLSTGEWLGKPIKVWETYPNIGWDVTFDLGRYGVRTGGGPLEQFVLDGEEAVLPEVRPNEGLALHGWSCSPTNVTGPLTVKAYYDKNGQPYEWLCFNGVDIADFSKDDNWLYEDGVLYSRYLDPWNDVWLDLDSSKRGFLTFEYLCEDMDGNPVAAEWTGMIQAIETVPSSEVHWQTATVSVVYGLFEVGFENLTALPCRLMLRNLQWEDPPEYVTITLDPRPGATLPDGQPSEFRLPTNGLFEELPVPTREGCEFRGWAKNILVHEEDGDYYYEYDWVEPEYTEVPLSDTTLYAIWRNVPSEIVVNPYGDFTDLEFAQIPDEPWNDVWAYSLTEDGSGRPIECVRIGWEVPVEGEKCYDVFNAKFNGRGTIKFDVLSGECGFPQSLQVFVDGNPAEVMMSPTGIAAEVAVMTEGAHQLSIRLLLPTEEDDYEDDYCRIGMKLGMMTFVPEPAPVDPPVVEPAVTNTITYLGLEGAANPNPATFTVRDLPLVLKPLTREGYTFLGWTPWDGVIPVGTASNVTFTALWEEIVVPPPEPPANPDAPSVIVDPAPKAEDVVPVNAEDVTSALAYNGYLAKGDEVVGSVTVKVAKKGKVTATVQLPEGSGSKALKKFSYAGTLGADGSVELSCKKNNGEMSVAIGAKALSGTVKQGGETYVINGRLGTKDTLGSADSLLDKNVWTVALHTPTNGVPHPLVNGYSVLTVSGAKKGKVKVAGFMADGTKVSVTAQGTVFDSCVIVPVNAALYKGKAGGFSLKLKIEGENKIEVGNVSDWTAVVDGKTVSVKWDAASASAKSDVGSGAAFRMDAADIPFDDVVVASADGTMSTLPSGVEVDSVGGKWSLPKAGKVAFTKDKSDLDTSKFGENPAGLKLSYASKTGAFKGSFSLYRETAPGKLKKEKATVSGVVVKGVGYGSAVIKNIGAMPVTVGADCGECRP